MPYKKRSGEELTLHQERQLRGIFGDFRKRAFEISRNCRREEVLNQYLYINTVITEALDKVCFGESERVKLLLLEALGEKRGYSWSPLCTMMSSAAFYERKYRVSREVAEKLNMI